MAPLVQLLGTLACVESRELTSYGLLDQSPDFILADAGEVVSDETFLTKLLSLDDFYQPILMEFDAHNQLRVHGRALDFNDSR